MGSGMGSVLTWPHGPQIFEGFFWTPFVCEGFFLDPFCVVGRPKKNLGSEGAGVSFSGQAFFRPFWNSPLSDVWVPVWAPT